MHIAKGEKVDIMYTAEHIALRVKEVAAQISRDYAGKAVTLLGTLKGGVYFMADLSREIQDVEVEIDFIRASSYGDGTATSGVVTIGYYPDTDMSNRHIILIEDIIDSGLTAKRLRTQLLEYKPASVKICALLDKPERRQVEGVEADYLGFTIPDAFVVGYGLDYAQRYRNLPFVGVLKFEE